MNKVWKWILGIVIVLVVMAAVAGVIYLWQTHPAMAFAPRNVPFGPNHPGWNGPRRFADGYGPMMRHRGFGFPFLGGFILLGGLVKLAIFGALLYFAYWLGKRNARITLDPKPAAPVNQPDSTPKRGRKIAKN